MENETSKQGKYLEKVQELRLLDDEFMSRVFDNNIACSELILRIILDREDIKIKEVHTQREIKNLVGRSIKLDIAAVDDKNRLINVEMQRASKGAGVKRARYNSSLLDANILPKGENYDALPENFVIFITEQDVIGAGLPIYHAERVLLENGALFGDGSHIIYVNGAYRNEKTAIGRLMHDFSCKNPEEMYYQTLAKQVKHYKSAGEGGKAMSGVFEEFGEEVREETKKENAKELILHSDVSVEVIAKCLKLPLETVKRIAAEEKALV